MEIHELIVEMKLLERRLTLYEGCAKRRFLSRINGWRIGEIR